MSRPLAEVTSHQLKDFLKAKGQTSANWAAVKEVTPRFTVSVAMFAVPFVDFDVARPMQRQNPKINRGLIFIWSD